MITGTIVRAWITQDGVTHVGVQVSGGKLDSGALMVRGEDPDSLIGCHARSADNGLTWVLTNRDRAAA